MFPQTLCARDPRKLSFRSLRVARHPTRIGGGGEDGRGPAFPYVIESVAGHLGFFGFEEGYMPQIDRHLGELLESDA